MAGPLTSPPGLGLVVRGALSGGLLVLAFPRFSLDLLAFVALVPWLAALPGRPPRRAATSGLAAGLAFYLGSLAWIAGTMIRYADLPGALAVPTALVVLLAVAGYLSLYVGAFAGLLAWLRPTSGPAFVWTAGTLWVALEYLRGVLLSGFPWNLLGYTQYQNFALLPLASVIGVYGLSFVVLAVNAALAWALCHGGRWQPARGALATAAAILLAGHLPGWVAAGIAPDRAAIPVSVIQGNVDQAEKWEPRQLPETVLIYQRLTQVAALATRPALIVWPETAVPFSLDGDERREAVLAVARSAGVPLVVGAPHRDPTAALVHNSAFLVDGQGVVADRYDKRHLVPFGEYVPLRRLFFFADWFVSGGIGEFAAGQRPGLFATGAGRFGVTICYEAIFPAEVRRLFAEGADFLVNLTNDAWFGTTSAPYQHLAMAALRAVENEAYVVRAANTGISALIGPDGRVVQASGLFTREVVSGAIAPRARTTFYTRYGDIFAITAVVGASLAVAGVAVVRLGPGIAPRAVLRWPRQPGRSTHG